MRIQVCIPYEPSGTSSTVEDSIYDNTRDLTNTLGPPQQSDEVAQEVFELKD